MCREWPLVRRGPTVHRGDPVVRSKRPIMRRRDCRRYIEEALPNDDKDLPYTYRRGSPVHR